MRFYYLLKNVFFSIFSKKTVGVRILLIQDNQVLLVKHTYQSGWYSVGGAVDPKETPRAAIERELYEEVGATLLAAPELFSVYYSNNEKRDDYIIFYIAKGCSQQSVTSCEIAEQRWFSLDKLPADISTATQRRINEYLGIGEISEYW